MKSRLLKYIKSEQNTSNNHYHVLYVKGKVRGKYRSIKDADLAMLRLQCMGLVVSYFIEPRNMD